ncbi:MAG TPA: leucyl aminopeptidase [Acidobacteriaceae bacterium]|nr:leucyl aminopeptidase [Acidobacteriaceae bacterium]
MKTELQFDSVANLSAELLVVLAADSSTSKDKNAAAQPVVLAKDTIVLAAAKEALAGGEFGAAVCETLLLHAPKDMKVKRLLVIGVGKESNISVQEIRKAAGTAVRFAKPRGIRQVTLVLPGHRSVTLAAAARAAVEGAFVGDFDPDIYRSDRKDRSIEEFTVVAPSGADKKSVEAAFGEGVILGEAQNFARSLVNEPGNLLTPTVLGQRAAAMCKEQGLACEVHSTNKLKELKMGAFWAVAQGSEEPPAMIVMRYEPANAPKDGPMLALVGKGITFDTGGISIKPADGMEKMKYDMAGGAAMIGAMRAIAQLKPNVRVLGIVCAAENMPSGKAYKPGDVVKAMSGKAIEVLNTDAEGRMVLADGLHYAKQLGATHLIDAATLTGACVVALGMVNAGAFCNDDETYRHFQKATEISGEKFWRLPVEDEYRDMIVSHIGDITNTGNSRWGGAITAAMFLKEFVDQTPWIHLDIAGVAWMEEQKPWIAKGPSGAAVRSIVEWVRSFEG